jgi:hypothetical protein
MSNPYGGGNANPGGPGGTRRVVKTSGGSGGDKPPRKCCPMVAALVSVKQGKFRLAKRYALMSVRLMAARIV